MEPVPGSSDCAGSSGATLDVTFDGPVIHIDHDTDESMTVTSRKRQKKARCLPVITHHPSSSDDGVTDTGRSKRTSHTFTFVHAIITNAVCVFQVTKSGDLKSQKLVLQTRPTPGQQFRKTSQ